MEEKRYTFDDLLDSMKQLRSDDGCPWDREQTYESLKKYVIEETYEVIEAVDLQDRRKLCEELGDLLLQVVFYAQIAKEKNEFGMADVIDGICRKLIHRHPHVFGDVVAETPDQVMENWEAIKKEEKGISSQTELLKDVPANLPALMRSYKVQEKAAQVGFDWTEVDDVFNKVLEEVQEIKEVYKSKNVARISEEIGDALFSLVNLSRFFDIQPELALTATTEKFIKRFSYIERESRKAGRKLEEMSLKEMDQLWDKSKTLDSQGGD